MPTRLMSQWCMTLCVLMGLINGVPAMAESCHVSTAALAFGAYNTASPAPLDVMGSLDLHCSNKVHAELSLSVGNGTGASYSGGRKMTRAGGSNTLTYNLYADAARTRVLGDGTHGSVTLKINSNKNNYSQTIWGRLPGGQTSALPGNYQDMVVATVSY
ncbi:spore coat U domain-containing protein [Rhodoferax sp.]|uniref:Csu type fimbrial protein n=1 Tax=Rhodoferax sp. TaxID=50421 RepID=UPI00263423A6|nr:spore coat U domain-containing protein [Rhodoferax sp.]MDD5480931.1 spore coat U domain-containing protein [Rhodoferax sp.]